MKTSRILSRIVLSALCFTLTGCQFTMTVRLGGAAPLGAIGNPVGTGTGNQLTGPVTGSLLPERPAATREELIQRALNLHRKHAAAIAQVLGSPDAPPVTVSTTDDPKAPPGAASGSHITLSWAWFEARVDDGCIIHEIAHTIQRAKDYNDETRWLVEGLADRVRDVMGFTAPGSFPHFEKGKAKAGYQTTADFLFWLEDQRPGGCVTLSQSLQRGTYTAADFARIYGAPLDELVTRYESVRTPRS